MKFNTASNFCVALIYSNIAYSQNVQKEFKIPTLSYLKDNVNRLLASTQNNTIIWDRLAEMTDLYGHRITGSKALEDSIDWIQKQARKDGLIAYTQNVTADYWKRNEESLVYHSPTRGDVKLNFLGLGRSVGTPKDGITAEVVTVVSKDDLKEKGEKGELKKKIVLCNFAWTGYGAASNIRQNCASLSENYGAVAALVRAATPFSIDTPHTGAMKEAKIPGAVVTVEDAQMLTRIQKRAKENGNHKCNIYKEPKLTLKMGATLEKGKAKTRNLILEIKGSEKSNEIVILSGHIDSWDVGVGAMDDAAGAFIGWEVLRQIVNLGLKPRRTLRAIFWTNEEAGIAGGKTYYQENINNLENHVLAMESDSGAFEPYGFAFSGNSEATAIFTSIGKELLGHTTFGGVKDADISYLCSRGIPCASLSSKTENNSTLSYFTFHHTAGDRMEVLKPEQLARNAAMTGGFIYAVADLKETLPKTIVPESN
ncbi:Zn-dependent exopeptidase [Neoconidiobolus thromboides FSU 785]|nr:Zn-dependent exopeptidase [Neoconidiobolus thromboides FSU 785]